MHTHLSFTGTKITYCISYFLFNSIYYLFICINIPPPIYKKVKPGIHPHAVCSLHFSVYTYLRSFHSPHVLNMYYHIISDISIASKSHYLIQYFTFLPWEISDIIDILITIRFHVKIGTSRIAQDLCL